MFHLLPEREKKVLKREYFFRLIVVFLCFCVTSVVIASVFLFPSYLLSERRLKDIQSRNASLKSNIDATADPALANFLSSLGDNLKVLTPAPETASSSVFLKKIVDKKNDGISITEFSITNSGDHPETILVGGLADTREDLTAFSEALKTESDFSQVDLPISDFAKEKNIDFELTLTIK